MSAVITSTTIANIQGTRLENEICSLCLRPNVIMNTEEMLKDYLDDSSCATPNLSDEESSLSSLSSRVKKTILLNKINVSTLKYKTERRVRGLWSDDTNHCFSKLHNDIVSGIFSYLSLYDKWVVYNVCKRWRYCVGQPCCWRDVVIDGDIEDELWNLITLKALHIESLSVMKDITSNFATLGIGSCTNLRVLHLEGYTALCDTHVNLMFLMKKHHLTSVSIEYCSNITDLSLSYILKHVDKLGFLSMKGCTGITDDGLLYLKSKLEEISPMFLMFPSLSSTTSQKKLHTLDLSHTNITAPGICNKLLSNQYKLQKLLLAGVNHWSNPLFHKLQTKLHWNIIQELDISTTQSYLTDDAFVNLTSSTSLHYFNVSGHASITGLSIASILKSNPNLQILDISGCTSIVQNLILLSSALRNTKLHTLRMKDCFVDDSTYSLVLQFIQSICQSSVREIDLKGCFVIDTHMVRMLKSCKDVIGLTK